MSPVSDDTSTASPASLGMDETSIRESILRHLIYTFGKTASTATDRDWFHALAMAVRDRLMERMIKTFHRYYEEDVKRVYYLSMEFLLGTSLLNSLINLGIKAETQAAVNGLGQDLDRLCRIEDEAALGNGGLGRLAACFLDSLATLKLPGYGYGIRYEYGMFSQRIKDGWQEEHPENWLRYGNPWELARPEVLYPVRFNGRVVTYEEEASWKFHWVDSDQVMAMAYDMPIPGFGAETVNNLRLWAAKSTRDFELQDFHAGDYVGAVEHKTASENLSKVLYPSESTSMGRKLRLEQEYFFVSASLQDILRRYLTTHEDFDSIPDRLVIQLNDTHPAMGIAEWMRLLMDVHGLDWDRAWSITRRTFSYTNHTLLPEALETWPVDLVAKLLPRHLQIIYEINHRFLQEVFHRFPGDVARLGRMSLIDEGNGRRVRMAHLALVGSHKVNGVSELHTRLLQKMVFPDFMELWPNLIVNVTNGVTPRRWLIQANPELAALLSSKLGDEWITDLSRLRKLEPLAEDAEFRSLFRDLKRLKKQRLCRLVEWRTGVVINPDSMFDVQVKRIHEYKRQLLNLLHVIVLYNRCRKGAVLPRTVIFAGKAAPGYEMAKLVVKLISDVADIINHDPAVAGLLKVVFIPNYDVSTACDIIPAVDLSEQISTAGMEASGTGNMKMTLNGALTIGTLDGANIEIREEVGEENFFLFGLTARQVAELQASGYRPRNYYEANSELALAIDQIADGFFSPAEVGCHRRIAEMLLHHDPYLVLADFEAYLECQGRVEQIYQDREEWARRAILNMARVGKFSSDRSILEYAEKVWEL